MKNFLIVFGFFLASQTASARMISVTGGLGDWYSDDLKSSYQYGGGILLKPGIEWLELSFSYDRAPVSIKNGGRWGTELLNKTLNFWRLGPTFPSEIHAMGLKAYLFPSINYVLTNNDDKYSHGVALGGGLEFLLLREVLGLRFEALEQMYPIPYEGGHTGIQQDFFFDLRVSLSY